MISKVKPASAGSLIILLVRVHFLVAYERKKKMLWKIRGRSFRSLRPGARDTLTFRPS